MPVARIVTHVAPESPELREVSEQLGAAGYEVVVAQPGSSGAADLIVELDQVPAQEALEAVLRLSRKSNTDLYVAPGLFAVEAAPEAMDAPAEEHPPLRQEPPLPHDVHSDAERGGVMGGTLEDLSAAVADGRASIRDTVSELRAGAVEAWTEFQQRRSEAARQWRLERERREMEREQRRREHEIELQRRAEEKRQLLAERERVAAEQERVLRAQRAHDAAHRAERERAEREAMAQEAARRAEIAYAEEQERRRLAAMQSEDQRVLGEQEAARADALEAQRNRAQRDQEAQQAAFADSAPQPAHRDAARMPESATASPLQKPRAVRPRRRTPSRRERQWQRAAFIASVAMLGAVLGFAIAANLRPSSPLPASLMQNSAEQQVPFGPAKVAPAKPKPQPATIRTAPAKPSPAKPVRRQRAHRAASSEGDIVAEDEVVVRHAPTSQAQRAQTQRGPATGGVRYYSDDN